MTAAAAPLARAVSKYQFSLRNMSFANNLRKNESYFCKNGLICLLDS
jgi:hypothetical protein